jgi:hypothetical protein
MNRVGGSRDVVETVRVSRLDTAITPAIATAKKMLVRPKKATTAF